jgi:hypothetical protein
MRCDDGEMLTEAYLRSRESLDAVKRSGKMEDAVAQRHIMNAAKQMVAVLVAPASFVAGMPYRSRHGKPYSNRDVVTCSLPVDSAFRRYRLSAASNFDAGGAVRAGNIIESPIRTHSDRGVYVAKGCTAERHVSVEVFRHDNLHRGLSGTTEAKGFPDEKKQTAPCEQHNFGFWTH